MQLYVAYTNIHGQPKKTTKNYFEKIFNFIGTPFVLWLEKNLNNFEMVNSSQLQQMHAVAFYRY